MNTLTLASIHASQGYLSEAISIYREILRADPLNVEAKTKLKELLNERDEFNGVDDLMKSWFVEMDSKEELLEFERWLAKSWS